MLETQQDVTQGALYLAMQITGSRDDALDILQNAVVKSIEHKNAPKPEEQGFKAWFYRVVHNQAIDWLRGNQKFDRNAEVPEGSSESDNPENLLEQKQRKITLHKVLNLLSFEQREIICLKDFHDLSYQEIAEIMDIEKGTVMSRLHRARQALKAELIKSNLFSGEENEL